LASALEPAGEVAPATLGSDPRGVSNAVEVGLDGAFALFSAVIDAMEGVGGGFILLLLAGTTTRIEAPENW